MMTYRLPTINDEYILKEYVQEHFDNNENRISASHALTSTEFSAWVEKMQNSALIGDKDFGKFFDYLCFDNDRLVGLLSIRYQLPEKLSLKYGDIGYGVRPTERKKGYATAMLRHALSVCKEKGLKSVLLSCYTDNLASAATIKKCGGVLVDENDICNEGKLSQYYSIQL